MVHHIHCFYKKWPNLKRCSSKLYGFILTIFGRNIQKTLEESLHVSVSLCELKVNNVMPISLRLGATEFLADLVCMNLPFPGSLKSSGQQESGQMAMIVWLFTYAHQIKYFQTNQQHTHTMIDVTAKLTAEIPHYAMKLLWWRRRSTHTWLSMVLRLHQHNVGYTADTHNRTVIGTSTVMDFFLLLMVCPMRVSVNTTSAPSAHRRPVIVDCHSSRNWPSMYSFFAQKWYGLLSFWALSWLRARMLWWVVVGWYTEAVGGSGGVLV